MRPAPRLAAGGLVALLALHLGAAVAAGPATIAPPSPQSPPAAASAADPELERLRDHLARVMPEVRREDVRRSPASQLFEVRIGNLFGYVTADGRYLVSGDIADLDSGERVTESRRREQRLATVAALAGGGIEFAGEAPPREWITVFTDFDCVYCRALHREVPRLNQLGFGVRYLFYSRPGTAEQSFADAQTLWCAPDRHDALDAGLLHGVRPKARSCDNPIKAQYAAAEDMGLRGTPALVLPDGSLSLGYARADDLVAELQQHRQEQDRLRAAAMKAMASAAEFSPQPAPAP